MRLILDYHFAFTKYQCGHFIIKTDKLAQQTILKATDIFFSFFIYDIRIVFNYPPPCIVHCLILECLYFYIFLRSTFVSSAWSFRFFIPAQRPMTSDFKGFLYQILSITILILEKEPVFPFFNVQF